MSLLTEIQCSINKTVHGRVQVVSREIFIVSWWKPPHTFHIWSPSFCCFSLFVEYFLSFYLERHSNLYEISAENNHPLMKSSSFSFLHCFISRSLSYSYNPFYGLPKTSLNCTSVLVFLNVDRLGRRRKLWESSVFLMASPKRIMCPAFEVSILRTQTLPGLGIRRPLQVVWSKDYDLLPIIPSFFMTLLSIC